MRSSALWSVLTVTPHGLVELVVLPDMLVKEASGLWNSQDVFSGSGKWLLLVSLWPICGSGTGAQRK